MLYNELLALLAIALIIALVIIGVLFIMIFVIRKFMPVKAREIYLEVPSFSHFLFAVFFWTMSIFIFRYLSIPLILLFLHGEYIYYCRSQKIVMLDIFAVLRHAVTLNLPLSEALYQASRHAGGKKEGILVDLAGRISEGYTLSEALQKGVWRCPGDVVGMIAMCEKTNQLSRAFDFIEKQYLQTHNIYDRVRPVPSSYIFVLITTMFLILLGYMYFIIPKYQEVFMDFDIDLPPSTIQLVTIADYVVRSNLWLWFLLFTSGWFLISSYLKFRPRDPFGPKFLSRLGDTFKWCVPGFHWLEVRFGCLNIIAYLKVAIQSGLPLETAVERAAQLDINFHFRRRMQKWHALLVAGTPVINAGRQARIPRLLLIPFEIEGPGVQIAKMMEMIETALRSLYAYVKKCILIILWPIMTIMLGGLVAYVTYAILMPIIKMVMDLTYVIIP